MKLTPRDNMISKNVGRWKLIKASTDLYNSLCQKCKHRVMVNPKIEVKDYCAACQKYIKEFEARFK